MDKLHVTIVSPECTLYDANVVNVSVPGEKGAFEILHNHAPIISSLSEGVVACQGEEAFTLEIHGGFVEVTQNEVSICVEAK